MQYIAGEVDREPIHIPDEKGGRFVRLYTETTFATIQSTKSCTWRQAMGAPELATKQAHSIARFPRRS
ncbi:hypothetical protein BH23ACT11_BH23ACT11_28550 [soil metagenome]